MSECFDVKKRRRAHYERNQQPKSWGWWRAAGVTTRTSTTTTVLGVQALSKRASSLLLHKRKWASNLIKSIRIRNNLIKLYPQNVHILKNNKCPNSKSRYSPHPSSGINCWRIKPIYYGRSCFWWILKNWAALQSLVKCLVNGSLERKESPCFHVDFSAIKVNTRQQQQQQQEYRRETSLKVS